MPRVIATAAFMLALVPGLAQAQLVQQHSFNINGDVVMVGNGLLTCSTTSGNGNSNCAGHQGGTGSNGQNADRDMVYINTDPVGGSAPANSSTATVTMPAGAIVRSAGLYWSGRSGDSNNARRNIHFKVPGGSYQQLTANSADVYTFTAQGDNGRRPYTAYRDVTSLVTASGSYSVGGLTSSIGTGDSLGLFGGWALIITYEHSSKPFRRLMVFNASNALQVSNGNPASATVSGLLTPPAGSFNAYMGALVWEGDDGITGDRFNLTGAGVLGGGSLSDAQSPNNNFWNSRISHLGSLFTGRNPAYANNFAIDLKMVDISSGSAGPRMANNATTADLQFTSTGDVYFPHALVFISDLFSPLVLPSMQKTVSNVSRPGATNVKPGETLEYTIKFGNTGQDGAIRVVLTDPIPAGTTYLPGSLRVHRDDGLGISSATPRSDGSGDDQAEFDTGNNRVVFRVGSGANATTGGMLAQNQQVDLRFRVTVNAGAGPTLTNVATLTHGAQTFPDDPDRTVTGSANTNIPVLLPSITVSKAVNPVSGTPVAPGDTLTYTLTVSVTNGPTMEPLVLTDTLSAQVNNLQVTNLGSFTQGGTATVPTFTLPTNTANGIYTVVYTVDVLAAASGNVGNQVVVTSGGGNPPPDCSPCSTSNPVAPSVTVAKTANPASGAAVVQGDTLTYTLTVVVANGPTTAPVELTDTLSTQVENLQVTNLGSFTQSGTATVPVFTLPANTANGSYSVTYTVVVKSDATGSVGNSVVVTNNGGDPTPSCPAGAPCTTTHTVNPSSADMVPVFSGLPAVLEPGELTTGTLTCTNNGPGSAVGASCVPSASAGTLSNVVCTPATPATVANGGSIVCTFDYTAPGTAGGSDTGPTSVTFTGTTGATNDSNGGTTTGGNNSTTATPPIVDAVDDTTSAPGGSTGNTFDLGGNDQVPPGSTFTLTGGTCANPSLTGSVVTYDATPNPCTVVYQVCAPAPNQTQCDTATLTVTSTVSDMVPVFSGLPAVLEPGELTTGTLTCTNNGPGSAVGASCVPSASAGTLSNVVCTPATPATVANGGSIVCTFDYTAPGTAGGSDTGPTSVTFTGTTGATNDSNGGTTTGGNNSTTATPPIVDAVDDTTSAPGGSTGNTFDLGGNDQVPPGSTFTLTGGTCANPSLTGSVVTYDATPNPCTVVYQVCAPAPNQTQCDTATLTVTSTVSDMVPVFSGLPAVLEPGELTTGTLTCTNNGPGSAVGASCVPSASAGTLSNVVCTPATPATVANGGSIVCTFDYTAPGTAGGSDTGPTSVTFTGTTGATNDSNGGTTTGGNNSTTATPPIVDAVDDTTSAPGGSTGNTFDLGGNDQVPPGSTFTLTGGTCANPSLTGSVVTYDATPNPCTVVYQVCAPAPNQTQCDTATLTVLMPAMTVVKSVTSIGPYTVGSTIGYSFLVTNTGSVTLTDVTVTDGLAGLSAVVCPSTTLAVGANMTCTATYVVTQTDVDAGNVHNSATASGTPPATPTNPNPTPITTPPSVIDTPIAQTPAMTVVKSVTSIGPYTVGSTISYSFLVTNTGSVTLTDVTVTDGLAGLSAVVCPSTTLAVGANMTCTATYVVTQTDVDAGNVHNSATASGTPPATPTNPNPTPITTPPSVIDTPIAQTPAMTVVKSVTSSGPYTVGSTISYSFLVTNTGSVTLTDVTVTDGLAGLSAVVCPSTTLAVGANMTCTATYVVTQTDVDAGNVHNSATASGTPPATPTNPNPTPITTPPSVIDTPIAQTPAMTVVKSVTSIGPYTVGSTISYSFLVTNTGSVTLTDVTVTDGLAGLSAVVCPSTTLAVGANMTCTATYVVTQTDVDAGNVHNSATASGTPPATPTNPNPTPITTPPSVIDTPIAQTVAMTVVKSVTSIGPYTVGSTISYSFLVTNTGSVTLTDVTVTDGLAGLSAVVCPSTTLAVGANMTCTATYVVTQTDVDAGNVHNSATASGTPPATPTNPNPTPITTPPSVIDTPIAQTPALATAKTATLTVDNGTPGVANIGDVITYHVTVTNTGNMTLTNVVVVDTLDGYAPTTLTCSPTTLAPGQVATCASYTHTVTVEDANRQGGQLDNQVVASATTVGSVSLSVTALGNAMVLVQPDPVQVRIVKTAGVRDVKVGDLVRYTLSIQNTGTTPLVNGVIVDTPPAGFSYVDGSLVVDDADDVGRIVGTWPLSIDGIDIPAGQTATVAYLLRVGAGVRAGIHSNSALVRDNTGVVSNVASADVQLTADPMLDESLILGTVFDDRDADGWQDSAALSGVRVQGGFVASAYVAGSTTVDRGNGAQPEADASSPLLHGIAIGDISGRDSDADPASAHRVVVSQMLHALEFDNDFVLTSHEGVTVRMDAAGAITVERSGMAAKGLTGAAPTVERKVSQVEGGYRVDYVIQNDGVDERGIPGVRIASVEGLLVETDQFGRYHLTGIDGGRWERGRNFILKVDPATVPPGSKFTTENPLLRRVTPGLPVRFDFGVKLPSGMVEGGSHEVELELGEVLFDPESASLRSEYLPVIERMAAQVREHGAGEVVIAANGESQALAYDRAKVVRDALLAILPAELAQATRVSLRSDLADPRSTLVSLGESPLLGTILFDTDKSAIKPEYVPVIEKIAADIEKLGGGVVGVIGHADRRGSDAYNVALGMRRAKAVYEAIAARLGAEARSRLRVEINDDPTAPVGLRDGREVR